MQKLPLLFALLISFGAFAQNSAPRYAFLEHVTNSRCSVCKSKNPAMFDLISQYPTEVHHLAYHPVFPYNTCIFYLANPAENNARANYYGVQSTPRVILNGTLLPSSSQLLPAATLTAQLGQESPVYVQVSETQTQVIVNVHTLGDKPAGNYVLYTALAEKTINYTSPNGETVHHDVFRDMLTSIDGDPIELPGTDGSISFSYPKSLGLNWNADEIYAVAWVQNTDTKEVLNSGTKFDPIISGINDQPIAGTVAFSPNPVTDRAVTVIDGAQPQTVEVYGIDGALVQAEWSALDGRIELDMSQLIPGIYFVQVRTESATFTGKLVKCTK